MHRNSCACCGSAQACALLNRAIALAQTFSSSDPVDVATRSLLAFEKLCNWGDGSTDSIFASHSNTHFGSAMCSLNAVLHSSKLGNCIICIFLLFHSGDRFCVVRHEIISCNLRQKVSTTQNRAINISHTI
jgi:hypothetical protein